MSNTQKSKNNFPARIAVEAKGSSLVELLVAIAILGIVAVTFITALSTGSITVNSQGEKVIAQGLANSQIEVIKSAAYDTTGNSYVTVTTPPNYSISISTNSNIYADNNIQKVSVTVAHNSQNILTLEGYKVNR
jgi:prepilin-type N-terminal cleavage/methylation domain-containing protein